MAKCAGNTHHKYMRKEGRFMKITHIHITPIDEEVLRAFVNITIDGCFMVRGLKIIDNDGKMFVAMPNKKSKNGMFRDVAHPLNSKTRRKIQDLVMTHYGVAVADGCTENNHYYADINIDV